MKFIERSISWLIGAIVIIGFVGVMDKLLAEPLQLSASSERLRDQVDRLKEAGPVVYCSNVAEFWDDGTWAASMGIDDAIFARPEGQSVDRNPDELPRDGIRHHDWAKMSEREREWYAVLFHDGWKAGTQFKAEHADVLIADPHDFTGVIPLGLRMQMKQARFEQCMQAWPPTEAKGT